MVFSSLKIPRLLIQTEVYCRYVFLLCLKKKKQLKNLQKCSNCENPFSNVYVCGTNCFDKYFVFHLINELHSFLWMFIVILRFLSTTMFLCSLKQIIRKKSVLPTLRYNAKGPKWSSHISYLLNFSINYFIFDVPYFSLWMNGF